ncbi:hypothetical protein DPSP01_011175 [Paraphaeosphaeria sporulosa]|uniref:Glutamyl-tRNA amidotransferase complex subunit Gta3 domain-containing protein n=1 Tax=Paraphaeosphaeria sporulosa TaxID=1460663 RepID=A0A177CIY9_9PLEO|nr:uncharacterized protein CC84DRAFT_631255 [Paraphaeosphaeria sporulosa]OAG06942.1 hypothetical protein CC84DRAFT_631255 [Paraphaeosphaeria sporulosa]
MILRRALLFSRSIPRHVPRPVVPLRTISGIAQAPNANDSLPSASASMGFEDIQIALESDPTWSVESLLPPANKAPNAPEISSQQLHHLLRLSALPLPNSQEDEEKMLSTLADQLHFVGKIQQVDTTGVKPLRAIRNETAAAEVEQTVTLETLKDALAKEKVIGKHYKRIQRATTPVDASDVESWDVLGSAERKQGKYFVVESERPQE